MRPGISFSLLVPFLVAAVKLTTILGLSWIAVTLLGRQSAAQRHRVWAAGVFSALLLPLLIAIAPMQYSGPLGDAASNWVVSLAPVSDTSSVATPPAATVSSPSYS